MSVYPQNQISWDDIPEYVVFIAALIDGIDQCSICSVEESRGEEAHLFLWRDGLLAITELNLPGDSPPPDRLLLIMGRLICEHQRASREGRSLV